MYIIVDQYGIVSFLSLLNSSLNLKVLGLDVSICTRLALLANVCFYKVCQFAKDLLRLPENKCPQPADRDITWDPDTKVDWIASVINTCD